MSTLIDSNTPKAKHSMRWLWLIPILILAGMVFLVILYYGIGFFFTRHLDSLYTERDCVTLVSSVGYVEKFYPTKIAPFTEIPRTQAIECGEYLKADALYEKKDWDAAYKAYTAYQTTYPKGIYAADALDLAANSLYKLALEQRDRHDYSSAVNNLDLLLEKHKNAPIMHQAENILPEVYLEWGEECRAESKFTEAEMVYKNLDTWASQGNKRAYVTRVRAELAQTYFDWGKNLQSERFFTQASNKFALALSTDPSPHNENSVTVQTQAYLPHFQYSWATYLISQGKYTEAISHLEISIDLSPPEEKVEAMDNLSQAYLNWAADLRQKEDYFQALEKIENALENAGSEGHKTQVETAQADTIFSFSRSNGSEAKKIMTDVSRSICTTGKLPETLPIIGISDSKRLVVVGENISLPNTILAQVPGDMHYVSCIDVKEVTVQTCPYSKSGYGAATYWIKRIRYDWQIKVFNSRTGNLFKEKTFTGSSPESCPRTHSFSLSQPTHYHKGDTPPATTITDWFASLLK
jgi:tetratricopeptide (TPR) repeat protein